jgi:hypothetical protein
MICSQRGCGRGAAWTYVWPAQKERMGCCVLHKKVVEDVSSALGVFVDIRIEDWYLLEVWEDAMVHDAIYRLKHSAYRAQLREVLGPALDRQAKLMSEVWKVNGWDIDSEKP